MLLTCIDKLGMASVAGAEMTHLHHNRFPIDLRILWHIATPPAFCYTLHNTHSANNSLPLSQGRTYIHVSPRKCVQLSAKLRLLDLKLVYRRLKIFKRLAMRRPNHMSCVEAYVATMEVETAAATCSFVFENGNNNLIVTKENDL